MGNPFRHAVVRLMLRLGKRTLIAITAGLTLIVALYAIFGFFILPDMVKSKTEQLVREKLNRQLSIEKVDVNPFLLTASVRGVELREVNSPVLFASLEQAELSLSVQTLFRFAPVVREIHLNAPYVHLVRTGQNHYNIDDIVELALQPKPDKAPARFSLYNIQVEGGRIEFDDTPKRKKHIVEDLKLDIPFISSLPSQNDIFVEPHLSAKVNGTPLLVKGKARPFMAQKDAVVDLQIDGIELPHYIDYLPFQPRFKLSHGKLNIDLTLSFLQPENQKPAVVIEGGASLKSVRLSEKDGTPMLSLSELALSGLNANLSSGEYRIGKIELIRPEVHIVKEKGGTINLARLAPGEKRGASPETSEKTPDGSRPHMHVALDSLIVKEGNARYDDRQAARNVKSTLDHFDLSVRKIALDLKKREISMGDIESDRADVAVLHGRFDSRQNANPPPAAPEAPDKVASPGFAYHLGKATIKGWSVRVEDRSRAEPAIMAASPLTISLSDVSNVPGHKSTLDLQAAINGKGHLAAKGTIGISPLQANLAMNLKDVDILALQPYFTDRINLTLKRASLSTQGSLLIAQGKDGQFAGGYKGGLTISDVSTVDKVSGNDFLRWKTLAFSGINAQFSPFSMSVNEVSLNDFFARIIINREGRINLQNIVRSQSQVQKSLTEEEERPEDAPEKAGGAGEKTAATTVPVSASAADKIPPVSIGKVMLNNGRVRFTDNFIQPNYSATLMNLGGTISSLSSRSGTAAGVDMRGQVSGAPLTIAGQVNPLVGNLYLDLKASVRGMELAPLSAYSGKYVGYGIEKGKLSFDVAYRLENRQLTAQNRLVLDQLVLGDKVDSPKATKLPVQLALALLKDSDGVIDLNLPISGSLNEPEFSIGGILFKAFTNLLAKAVTSPFSLLGSMFGGHGEELSWVEFEPGSRAIPDSGKQKLESLAKALADRPALKMEITGRVDPVADKEGLGRASIQRKVRTLKMRDLEKKGQSVEPSKVVVQPAEYPALLERVYKDEPFSKPRNLIGLPKKLPVADMERLMLDNYTVNENDLVALANQRAMTVKDWLVQKGVPEERIFILAGKTGGGTKNAKASRVDFSLR